MNESCVINPTRSKGEKGLPEVGIFAINPTDAVHFPGLAKQYNLRKQFLFHSQLFAGAHFFLAGPAVGAPMAALCLEKCIALGAKRIIVYSWCGAVSQQVRVGDVVLPVAGLSEEGTSKHYGMSNSFESDGELTETLATILERDGYSTTKGLVWTTDAVYRETKAKVAQYGASGVLGVDMEYTALARVSTFRGIALSAAMLVSDELYHDTWLPQFHTKTFRSTSKQLLVAVCQAAASGDL